MESIQENAPTVIQYYKGNEEKLDIAETISENEDIPKVPKEKLVEFSEANKIEETNQDTLIPKDDIKIEKTELSLKVEKDDGDDNNAEVKKEDEKPKVTETLKEKLKEENDVKIKLSETESENASSSKEGLENTESVEVVPTEEIVPEKVPKKRGRKRKYPLPNPENESLSDGTPNSATSNNQTAEDHIDSEAEEEDEIEIRPRKRGRCKKNPDVIPPFLSSDITLGYKILLKFLETPQFSGFHKPLAGSVAEDSGITCLNQIKKKFEENTYKKISEFINDVREMLTNIYESRNAVATKRALRLEQILEQRIAQLPNYLRPQCALILSPEDLNNSQNKIRINKGGGFVSLLLEKAEKRRCEKDKEKRKLLAEERKQLKEEQDKDVQEWEKNVLLKDHEEEIKSMWELPAIGHFIHLCTDILNIGEVAQYEIERMLLMPQCSETLDLIMTALLSNSLVRAKLDRTPPMPYSIWSPLVTTRVISWYRAWHREGKNHQKVFEEIGVEPEFWQVLGPDLNPLEYHLFHEVPLLQRVWILKTLCDVDFVRKKTVHDNIRAQTLDELNPVILGIDRHGNRYLQLKQFCGPDMRIYRQCSNLEDDFNPADLIESIEGFEQREGPITIDKIFKDIWDVGEKPEIKVKKKKVTKVKKYRISPKVNIEIVEKKNLRQSARAKQRSYVDSSDSDQSDTDLATLKSKLHRSDTETLYRPFSDREFISLSVFRLPRDKVSKPTPKRNSYISKKFEDFGRNDMDKCAKQEDKKDVKATGFEDEASDSLDLKQMQDVPVDYEKGFQVDDLAEDDFDIESKLTNFSMEKSDVKDKFTVKNLDNLKMVLKKGEGADESSHSVNAEGNLDSSSYEEAKTELPVASGTSCDTSYKYDIPEHLKPDSNKFYLVVDSVDGLRQLISKFASQENDLEIISRSTKSNKKNNQCSCEVQLIERLQNLLVELEPWEWDLIKSSRSNREKMYKEYMNFINRTADFIHPNEAYWMKMYEEPTPVPANNSTSDNSVAVDTSSATIASDKTAAKEKNFTSTESTETGLSLSTSLDELAPRKRTRVTRLQLKLDEQDELDEELGEDDTVESSESDDNWELPKSQRKKVRKEPTPRITRPKRSGRKSRGNAPEKIETQTLIVEKLLQSPPQDKNKKALFWGPRSSDPSEDLNWETNRQKILEKHNSPTKKILLRGEELVDDIIELDNAFFRRTGENSTKTVITSPKRFITQIPGNKKPYFSSAQLKAMEEEAKQKSQAEKTESVHHRITKTYSIPKHSPVKGIAKTSSTDSNSDINNEGKLTSQATGRLIQMDQFNSNTTKSNDNSNANMGSSGNSNTNSNNNNNNNNISNYNEKLQLNQPTKILQSLNKTVQSLSSDSVNNIQTVITTVNETSTSFQQPTKIIQQMKRPITQIQSTLQKNEGHYQSVGQAQKIQSGTQLIQIQKPVEGQIQEVHPQGSQVQQKPVLQQLHIQQPINQITQVQIPQSLGQIHPAFIQTNTKDGTVSLSNIRVHQPVQLQTSNVITMQQPVQLQSQSLQMQTPRVTTIQQPVQVQTKVGTGQQSLQTSQQTVKPSDNDLYLTDGTVLIKADSNFVQQFMQKDKVLTLNVNEKLDLKKPLFIVKPKTDVNVNTSQSLNSSNYEPPTSQQNVIVFNKTPAVQQNTVPTSVTNLVIPTSYIVSDSNSTVQSQVEPSQNLTVVEQNPTFIIRQKPLVNKINQPQLIKIIDPQNMTSNQNIIISPANIKFTNQVIRPVNQSVVTSEQSKPTSTLRFIRPQNIVRSTQSVIHNKISTIQNSKGNLNNVEVQTSRSDVPKRHPSVITSKINTPVPIIRINAPVAQAQPIRTVVSATNQPVRFTSGNTSGIRLVNRFVRPPKTSVITSTSSNPLNITSNTRPPVTVGQSIRLENINLQPSIIKTGQNRLQLTPTKFVTRANTSLTNPIIITVEEQADAPKAGEEKSIPDQAVAVNYLPGELSVKERNQSWMYVVKASDGSDVILTNEQSEDTSVVNSDKMK